MIDSSKPKREHSAAARERMRTSALGRHDNNAAKVHERVRKTMDAIKQEVAGNDGIYPRNGGAVSLAEIARRAEIHPNTFYKDRYVELGKEVTSWLETLKVNAVVGRVRVRTEVGARLQQWKDLYHDLLESHRIAETDLAYALARLEESQSELEKLRRQLAEVSAPRIVPLRPRGSE